MKNFIQILSWIFIEEGKVFGKLEPCQKMQILKKKLRSLLIYVY